MLIQDVDYVLRKPKVDHAPTLVPVAVEESTDAEVRVPINEIGGRTRCGN